MLRDRPKCLVDEVKGERGLVLQLPLDRGQVGR
jgi:hypothetical protein